MLKAIETEYKNTLFRSRIEARWAVFFDSLDVKWEYEKEGYDLDGVWYLPDFRLSGLDCYFEVKPNQPTRTERRKTHLLAMFSGKNVYTFFGDIQVPDYCYSFDHGLDDVGEFFTCNAGDIPVVSARVDHPGYGWGEDTYDREQSKHEDLHWRYDYCHYWCECPKCGKLGIQFNGIYTCLGCGCFPCKEDWRCSNYNSPRLVSAYRAARSACFEHQGNLRQRVNNGIAKIQRLYRAKGVNIRCDRCSEMIRNIRDNDMTVCDLCWKYIMSKD